MAEAPATPPATSAATPAPGTGEVEPAGQGPTVQDTLEGFQRQLNSLSYQLRKFTKTQAPASTGNVSPPEDGAGETKTGDKAELEALAKQIREDRAKAESERRTATEMRIKSAIKTAIAGHSVTDAVAADLVYDHIERRHFSKLSVSEHDPESIVHTDAVGEMKTLADFVGDILKGPVGKVVKPEKAPPPTTRPGKGGSSTASVPGQKSYMDMTLSERLALNPDQTRQAIAASREQ